MSRTRPVEYTTSPARFLVTWDSDGICWKVFDRREKVELPYPATGDEGLRFIVLDQWNSVGGFNDELNNSYYGNEVRNVAKEPFTVYCKKKLIAEGLWADIKNITGLSFAKIVYVMVKVKAEYEVARIAMTGASCGAWFEFVQKLGGESSLDKENKDIVISVSETIHGKKGKVEFNTPVFAIVNRTLTHEAIEKADAFDMQLQAYFDKRVNGEDNSIANAFWDACKAEKVDMKKAFAILTKVGCSPDAVGMTAEQLNDAIAFFGSEPSCKGSDPQYMDEF